MDPFREQLTVECESVQLTVAFRDVLPPPVFTPVVKRKRPVAPRVITPSEPQSKKRSFQFTCPFGQVQCVFCLSEPQNYLSKNRQPQQY